LPTAIWPDHHPTKSSRIIVLFDTRASSWLLQYTGLMYEIEHRECLGMRRRNLLVTAVLALAATAARAEDQETVLDIRIVPHAIADRILGWRVLDRDGDEIGHLVDVLVNKDGQPRAGVIDVGGFLGVGTRRIAIAWSLLDFSDETNRIRITENLSLDEIATAPEYAGADDSAIVVGRRSPRR
jgi:hypothetical protein